MKRIKVSPTRNYTISSTSWLGRLITEYVTYAYVMLDDTKEYYVLNKDEYESYAVAAFAELSRPYEEV